MEAAPAASREWYIYELPCAMEFSEKDLNFQRTLGEELRFIKSCFQCFSAVGLSSS